MSTCTIDQLERYMATLEGSQNIEQIRVACQLWAQLSEESLDVRRRWAKLSLAANALLSGYGAWDQVRQQHQNFALRAWIIERFGPSEDPDWDPQALAADTLAALSFDANQAAAMSAMWRDLPMEQINELRRHKNLTAHLGVIVGYLQASPIKDRLIAWLGVRDRLP